MFLSILGVYGKQVLFHWSRGNNPVSIMASSVWNEKVQTLDWATGLGFFFHNSFFNIFLLSTLAITLSSMQLPTCFH